VTRYTFTHDSLYYPEAVGGISNSDGYSTEAGAGVAEFAHFVGVHNPDFDNICQGAHAATHSAGVSYKGVRTVGGNRYGYYNVACASNTTGTVTFPTNENNLYIISSISRNSCTSLGEGWTYSRTDSKCHATGVPANQWTGDGRPTAVPTGSGDWAWSTWDSDNVGWDAAGNPIRLNGTSPDSLPMQTTYTGLADGGVKIEVAQEFVDTGTTYTSLDTVTLDKYGSITNYTTNYYAAPIQNVVNNSYVSNDYAGSNQAYGEGYDTGLNQGTSGAAAEVEFPEFCSWASTVCDWYNWAVEAPIEPENPDVPVETTEDLVVDWDSSLGAGSCPTAESMGYGGETWSYSFEPACDAADIFRPILIALCSIGAAFIIVGARAT